MLFRSKSISLLICGILIIDSRVSSAESLATEPHQTVCERTAQCETLTNSTCFGTILQYTSTSLHLVDDADNQKEIDERLHSWEQSLRQIPRCWTVVQPLLCAIYKPPCNNSLVPLPSRKLCEAARKNCRITSQNGGVDWPHFLRCEQDIFSKGCRNEKRIRFNSTGYCAAPLVESSKRETWFPEVEGCGVSCHQHPLLSTTEHEIVTSYVKFIAIGCLTCCLFTLLTLLLDWSTSKKYPGVMMIYCVICLLIVCFGYSAQFIFGRESVLCRKDGTLRSGEPSSEENLMCVAVFICTYYFLFAALSWFVLICYAWSTSILRSTTRGVTEAYWESQATYFHLISWSIPLILTIGVMALSEIHGDSVTGICFVSQDSIVVRIVFVVIPTLAVFCTSGYFLLRLEYNLIQLKNSSLSMLNEQSREHVEKAVFRLGLSIFVMFVLTAVTLICHIYEFRKLSVWKSSLREHLSCRANAPAAHNTELLEPVSCDLKARPSITMIQIHVTTLLFVCIAICIAALNSSSSKAWKRFFLEIILRRKPAETPKQSRNQAIAEAFAQCQQNAEEEEEHDRAALNSVSQDFSSTWTSAIPGSYIGHRGVAPPLMVSRRYSSTSDVSRQISNAGQQKKWMHSMAARRRKTRKERDRPRCVERTTSTGDLGYPPGMAPLLPQQSAVMKPMIQKRNLINPPFTHGMSGEARDNKLNPIRPKVPRPKSQPQVPPQPPPGAPLYATMPPGYPPFAAQPYPMIDPYTGYPITSPYQPFYLPMLAPPMGAMGHPQHEFVPFPDLDNIRSPLIPLRAMETGSEASFKMPQMTSDTEYDTGNDFYYRPQTAVPRDRMQPKSGRLSAPPRKTGAGFMST